jgi:hypothetical protein
MGLHRASDGALERQVNRLKLIKRIVSRSLISSVCASFIARKRIKAARKRTRKRDIQNRRQEQIPRALSLRPCWSGRLRKEWERRLTDAVGTHLVALTFCQLCPVR